MQGQEYLNQISAKNRPIKASKTKNILTSKFFLIGVGALVALIIIMIIGGAISGGKGDVKTNSFKLFLHLKDTTEVIEEYQKDVKSSNLRASSESLRGVLSSTRNDLTDYLAAKYDFKEKSVDKKLAEAADLERDGLMNELFEAKINGNLDRIFAHKMAYEISLLMSEENSLSNATGDENLKEILNTSTDSLTNLYNNFNDFSETK